MSARQIALGELMPSRIPSVNPAKHLHETFELWSIPAFDQGEPEIVSGSEIGSSKKCVEPGDVLLSRIVPHIRRSWVVRPSTDNRQIASGEWITFRGDDFDPNYLRHILTSDPFHSEFMQTVAGVGGSLLRARPEGVKLIKIPLPPLEEQKRIAGILDQAAELCRLRTRALDKLNTLGQAIFHEIFGETQPVMEAVGNLGEVQGGLQVSKKRDFHERRAPYLRVANVYRDRLVLDEIKTIGLTDAEAERTELQSGDVLIVEGHGNPDEIGRTAVWGGEIVSCVHQNHLIRFRPNQTRIIPQFFSSYMNSTAGRKHLTSSSRTTTGLNTISTKKVKECIIPVPDIKEQMAFLAGYEGVERQAKKLTEVLAKQETLFASLQHRAFRGEL
ncbi:restriction endonuclease subunit S [Mameliella sediminis]|uniref:restriction endonuclease subunit S n=1 Tax=Mameliella sediminis TaxID=2836866 RepID=UPI001C47A0CB|nr:restriction endonuclease subunit S [Mameliella sediminis]MBV7394113.1 restriction endonuclease subunit S [Mameliella sediminis]